MFLNTLKPGKGSKKSPKRLGRGIGSGLGKTSGKGHKGQKARAGGYHKVGFEGGQMPLQRRLPKRGFRSLKNINFAEIRTSELNLFASGSTVDLLELKKANLVNVSTEGARVFLSGDLTVSLNLRGIKVTKGALEAIKKAGGSVEAN